MRGYPVRPGKASGEARQLLVYLLVVLALVAISFVVFPTSSEIRWAILVLVLMILGTVTFLSLYRSGAKVPGLKAPHEAEEAFQGEFARLTDALERAERGMPFSQASVAWRVRKAFLTRLKSERGLGEEELAALLDSPGDLKHMVGDPVIRAFLEDTAPTGDGSTRQRTRDPSTFRFARRGNFTRGITRVVAAMEAWS